MFESLVVMLKGQFTPMRKENVFFSLVVSSTVVPNLFVSGSFRRVFKECSKFKKQRLLMSIS